MSLSHDLDLRGSLVNISLNGLGNLLSIRIRPGMIFDLLNGVEVKTNSDRSFVKTTEFGHKFTLKPRVKDIRGKINPSMLFCRPSSSKQDAQHPGPRQL